MRTPAFTKSARFRVAIARPWTTAVAAIRLSLIGMALHKAPIDNARRFAGQIARQVGLTVVETEMINNKIRVFQRRAYGLRDEDYLRLKILTCSLPEL